MPSVGSERLDDDLAAIEGSFGALDGEELVLDRSDGTRGSDAQTGCASP